MSYSIISLSENRRVTLCGTNFYPKPELHLDRVMEEHDLLYIFSGGQGIQQDDESFDLQAGDLIFLRAGSHHFGTTPCTVNMRSIFIHVNTLPGDRGAKYLSMAQMDKYNKNNQICIPTVIHIGQNNGCTTIINSIIDLFWSHNPNKDRRLTLLFNLLLDEIGSMAAETEPQKEEWTAEIISLFRKNLNVMYSLDEVAQIVDMNVRTLSARFKEITGESIHQYQLNIKLEAAYSDLRSGQRTVKDVALSYGFCDAYYFSRLFKKKFGISPNQIKIREPSANINREPVV